MINEGNLKILILKRAFYVIILIGYLIASTGQANLKEAVCQIPFTDFLGKMAQKAKESGISDETIAKVSLQAKHLDRVIELDRDQKAFRMSFTDFSNRSVNQYRLRNGKKNIDKHYVLFEKIRQNYGIPPEVITSFWAMETDFGEVQGNFHVLSALATLAHDCRRSKLFQSQYLAAMKLVDVNILDAENSTGAWAGEFGQIQMLPSDVISFGVDGDGDGKVQLDKSASDTILTAAELILSKGWDPHKPWFEEVKVNKEFAWKEAGLGRSRPMREWERLGVKPRNGHFEAFSGDSEATLILPQGRKGPKFLAYSNFDIFMKWNDSFLYSTTAAYLANRLKGDSEFLSEFPADILSFSKMIELQEILSNLGYEVGKIDGILGAKTRQSVRKVQIELGFPADSWPTIELLDALN